MKLTTPVKGIFFDAGWTLFRPAYDDWFLNKKLFEYVSPAVLNSIPRDKITIAFNRASQYLDENHLLTTEEEEYGQFVNFYKIIADSLPELALTNTQIEAVAHAKVFDMGNYRFFEDTKQTLDALRGKYKLGIISDTWPSIHNILKHGGISDYFDTATFSCYLGTYKPDARMYHHALEQMGFEPGQTVFIDDSATNLDGAAKCGIQPVFMNSRPHALCDQKYPSISRLPELLDLLPNKG